MNTMMAGLNLNIIDIITTIPIVKKAIGLVVKM